MASVIIFFLLFILPFVIAPFGITQFEDPKVIGAEAGIILLLIISVFTKTALFRYNKTQFILYFFIIILTVIDLFFFRTTISLFGNAFRMQGIFLLWMLLLFSFLTTHALANNKQSSFSGVLWWVYLLLLFMELIAIFFLPLNASQRYVGTLGEPNALAAYAVFLWPFVWFAPGLKTKARNAVVVLGLFIVCMILVLSGSRSGMIAFGIQIACIVLSKFSSHWFIIHRKRSNNAEMGIMETKQYLKLTVMLCLCLYFLSYFLPFFDQVPYENRVEVWEAALTAGIINPLFGQGFGNTEIALHTAAVGLNLPIQYYYVDSSHNIFLDWWVQGGIVGVGLLLFLVFNAIRHFLKTNNKRNLVLLLGIVTMLSFNPSSVVGLLAFWWLIGQGFA